jgi:hypothetical protein
MTKAFASQELTLLQQDVSAGDRTGYYQQLFAWDRYADLALGRVKSDSIKGAASDNHSRFSSGLMRHAQKKLFSCFYDCAHSCFYRRTRIVGISHL